MIAQSLAETTNWADGLKTPHGGHRLSGYPIDAFVEWCGYDDNVNVPLDQSEIYSDGPEGHRRWIVTEPWKILRWPMRDVICCIEKVNVGTTNYSQINNDFGDKWGVKANYFIIPTTFIYGLNGVTRLIPTIPPSRNGTATCMILYGVFAPYDLQSSHYCWDLCRGLDPDLICPDPVDGQQFTGDVNLHIQTVCDLAHARGLKIGFSMRTSEQQMRFGDRQFSWQSDWDVRGYIEAAKNLVNLGMDAIYLDCAFLAGGGGEWIPYGRLQEVTSAIRSETERGGSVAILGEGCDRNWGHWKYAGITAGFHEDVTKIDTDGNFFFHDRRAAEIAAEQDWTDEYRSGWHTRVDNDFGTHDWVLRTGVSHALTRQGGVSKVPGMMSLTDFYLLDDTNIHYLIEGNSRWDHSWKWHGFFQESDAAYQQRLQMNDICLQGACEWEPG